jgi:lysophospholipase L1-like esterase
VSARATHVEVAYFAQPQGGSFDVFIDHTRASRIATRAPQAQSGFFALDVPDAGHEVEVRAVGDGDVRIFGMTLDRSQAGVVVDSLGINGAQIFTVLRFSESHFAEQLRHRAPDLVVLAYGTNESIEELSSAEYERKLVELLGRVARAVPTASCLLLGPPDRATFDKGAQAWKTTPRIVEIVESQRKVARAAGCAFYDQMHAMGGEGSVAAWASEPQPRAWKDRVHLTREGYAQLGTAFEQDLVRAYESWRADVGLAPAPRSAPRTWGAP